MESKKHDKKIGVVFGLKNEMNFFSIKRSNIFYNYGYGKHSKQVALEFIKKKVDLVVNFGFAGSISKKLNNGDIVLVKKIYDTNKNIFNNKNVTNQLFKRLKQYKYKQCNILTVDKILFGIEEKIKISRKFSDVSVIDMEAYNIKKELSKKEIPMICVKVIFDDLSFDIPCFLKNCINEKGDLKKVSLLTQIILKPMRIKSLWKLNKKYSVCNKIFKQLINYLLA